MSASLVCWLYYCPNALESHTDEIAFISALGMVSSESWKKDFISTDMHTTIAVAQINC